MGGKVIVTGGCGMVGTFVCRALLAEDYEPVVVDTRTDRQLIVNIAEHCAFEAADVRDLPRLLEIAKVHKVEAIIHLAGLVGPDVESHPWNSIQTNLLGTVTVLECARLAGIGRVLFPSSKMVYVPVPEHCRHPVYDAVSEDIALSPQKLYSKIKRTNEDLAGHYASIYGLDVVALRFGSTFAPGKAGRFAITNPVISMIEAAAAEIPYQVAKGGDQCDDVCYCGESANGFMTVLRTPPRHGHFRAYNISHGELISLRQMADTLRNMIPGWRAEIGPGLDYRNYGLGAYFRMSLKKAAEEIGYQPKFDFRLAAADYIEMQQRLNRLRM